MAQIIKKEDVIIICILAIISSFIFFFITNPKQITIAGNTSLIALLSDPLNTHSQNILILGKTGAGNNGSYLTDVILLVNINFTNNKVTLMSIPRDLLVQIPNSPKYIKINGLLAEENALWRQKNQGVKTWNWIKTKVEDITALKVDNVAIVDLDGFRYFIDSIGGINIYLEQPLIDPNLSDPDNPNDIFRLEAGWNYLNGQKAAKFIRSRFGPTGDFYRITHQHDLLAAIFQKLKALNIFSNVPKLLSIWNSWKGYLFTDIGINEVIKLTKFANNLNKDNLKFITISYNPPDNLLINPGLSDFGYILIPKQGIENYTEIREYIHNKLQTNK